MSGQAKGQRAAFGRDRLKVAAEERFYSLASFARELGVAEKTVYRWNNGEVDRDPTWFYGEEAA